ncbi:MAG: hypothetical protein ACFE9Q_08225 [Candidatus Hodarchaeota archaeon]
MSEIDQLYRDKYRFIIYHGHIHILPIYEEIEDNDNLYEIQKSDC